MPGTDLQIGVDLLWWPSFDDRGPHPWPFVFFISRQQLFHFTTLKIPEGWEQVGEEVPSRTNSFFPHRLLVLNKEHTFMSQLAVSIGLFESVSQARKSGLDKEITIGEGWFKKKTVHLQVHN